MPIKPIFIKFPPITISWTPKGPAGSIAMMELWQFRGRVAYWPFCDAAQKGKKPLMRTGKIVITNFEAAMRAKGPNKADCQG